MILVDSNIPMYLVGASHPNKQRAQDLLESLVIAGEALVTDVEVLQEILHRYTAIARPDAIQPAFDALTAIVDEVLAIDSPTMERAKQVVLGGHGLSARDAVHVAVMEREGIRRILSFDRGFDAHPGLIRLA